MRTILYILQKEFIQVFRNKTMLPIIFILPLVQLIILVYAASLELKDIKMEVVDFDNSSISREIISGFQASPFYTITDFKHSVDEAEKSIIDNTADVVMVIPAGIEKDLLNGMSPGVQFQIDAINGMTAGLINSYSSQILMGINTKLSARLMRFSDQVPQMKQIEISRRFWYNAGLNYKHYMVPGILVILVTVIGMFLTALNIVREKEMGTIEQINVTPIKKYQFMMGKLIPFLIIGLFELALGLTFGWIVFDLPFRGSLLVLFAFAFLYLILVLGFGLLLSTISNTQQQVMFMSFFFLLVFILMSGLFTPIETMPHWAQQVNIINPFAYFMKVNRMVLLKGSGFADLTKEFLYIGIYATVVLSFAVKYYRKTV
ncbi:MAG: ABC transporter permease [Bacteroidales bacterium]|nr:ABC transporter permease [Bacteroidales bacterium]MCF8455238.1 ABC transporter permease [Bacteroidales bacterium]